MTDISSDSRIPASAFQAHSLKDRVAVVTGAGGGLGTAIVQRLAGMGAHVVLVDLKAPREPPGVTDSFSLACDIADSEAVAALGQAVERRFGRCDILVNNAGVKAVPMALEDFPLEDWDRVFSVNVRGAFLCARSVVKMMLARGSGAIVNIASIGAQLPTRVGAYGASKAAICGLTRQMAVEWGPRGIRANPNISPYPVEMRTALPLKCPIIEVSNRDERAGNAEAKLYRSRARTNDRFWATWPTCC